MKTPVHLLSMPLIGLSATVVRATNPSLERLTGDIIDETQNLIILSIGSVRKQIPKSKTLFAISTPNGRTIQVEGKTLLGHPAERLRKVKRQRW